jgi:hypothetical protein
MGPLIRGAIVVLGIVFMLSGLAVIVTFPELTASGLWGVAVGAFLVVIPLLERQRYRSEAAEKAREAPGRAAAKRRAGRSRPASVRRPRSSSIPRPATRCGSSWIPGPASGGTSPRPDLAASSPGGHRAR